MTCQVALMGFVCFLNCSIDRSLESLKLFSRLLLPQIPPNEFTKSSTPLVVFTLSLAVSILMTRLKALPSQSMAARGASCARCSWGHSPARNSSFFEYSFASVSPGRNTGIIFQGRCDKDGVVALEEDIPPAASELILDLQLPEEKKPLLWLW